ncbi:MAG: NADH-quinone oxidoreductase subunit A [Chloroflexi bacterium]|nr:MAG: NADH-quinone oxidoreductase subunit A [Chloroflexota bacterium]
MLQSYLPILILVLLSLGLAGLVIVLGNLFGPHRPTPRKLTPYESGMVPFGPAQRRVDVRFYRIAVLFILFDIEIIFMYPWAVLFMNLSARAFLFAEMVVFVLILLIGYIYVWRKGGLEWD